MSKYTTEVRFICEHDARLDKSVGFNDVDDVLEKSWDKIFTTKVPFWDEDYRKFLCIKILKHYYTREIGAETVGLWKLWMNRKLEEIMPYYNQLYDSTQLDFNPLYDVDVIRRHEGTEDGTTNRIDNTISNGNNTVTSNGTSNTDENYTDNVVTDSSRDTDSSKVGRVNTTNTEESDSNETTSDSYSKSGDKTGVKNGSGSSNETRSEYHQDTPQGGLPLASITSNNWLTDVNTTSDHINNSTDESTSEDWSESGTSKSTSTGHADKSGSSDTDSRETTETEDIYHEDKVTTGNRNTNAVNKQTTDSDSSDVTDYTSDGTSHSENVSFDKTYGKVGGTSYSDLLLRFRDTFINIDIQVINEFKYLFLNLW